MFGSATDAGGASSVSHPLVTLFAQRPVSRSEFSTEEFRLFPVREVVALVELVVMDELGIGPLRPTSRSLIELVREHAHGHRDGDVLWGKIVERIFPIETGPGHRRVRQPEERDVVEDIVWCRACWLPVNAP